MREYPDNHRRLLDGGDDLELAATLRAVFEVDIEHALEQARSAICALVALVRAGVGPRQVCGITGLRAQGIVVLGLGASLSMPKSVV